MCWSQRIIQTGRCALCTRKVSQRQSASRSSHLRSEDLFCIETLKCRTRVYWASGPRSLQKQQRCGSADWLKSPIGQDICPDSNTNTWKCTDKLRASVISWYFSVRKPGVVTKTEPPKTSRCLLRHPINNGFDVPGAVNVMTAVF